MTFNFDGGDILVILLVVIAFILFRRFDKTGRSLEKVRRYADKSKADLDTIVRERELGIKDLAVDLEVQEKTNREILARAEAAREEIMSRAEELESRVERIEIHEKALEDLNDLALRVDENLSRLKEESAYVDDVGTRMTDVREKFSTLAEKDAARFAAFRDEVIGTFGSEINQIRSGLDESGRDLAMFRETLEGLNARRDTEVTGKLAAFRDDLEQAEEDYRERLRKVADEGARLEDDAFSALNEKIDSRSERLENNWVGGMNELKERVSSTAAEIQSSLTDAKLALDTWETESAQRLETVSDGFLDIENRLTETSVNLDKNLDELRGRLDHIVDTKETELLETVEIRQNEYRKTVEERFSGIEGFVKDMDSVAEGLKVSQQQVISDVDVAFTNFDVEMSERRELEKTRTEEDAAEFSRQMNDLRGRLDHIAESKETELLETVEIRQNEYRKTVEERFSGIEGFIKDMDTVAESLKVSQKQVIQDVEAAFTSFDVEMSERRELDKTRIEEDAAELSRQMIELEQGLDELKSRAYDNVSEKLQVFEDDFFADLKNRDEQMRGELESWRKNVELELGELGLKGTRDREETERRYSTDMKQKLTDLQTRIFGQFETFQDQVDGFRESLSGRIRTAEEELSSFREDLSSRITTEKENSFVEFNKVFEGFDKEVGDKFTKANKIIGQKLADFSSDIETQHRELTNEFQTVKDESSEWKERIGIQMQEAQRGSAESVDTMKSEFAAMMSELQDEYAGKTEQLVLESGEERSALRREIAAIEESITSVSSELTEKTRDSLDTLKEQSESYLLEFRKNSREARDDVERKIKELRQSVQESRDKAESNRKEMTSHTDTEYARLMRNLDEIDRRQREFISETRVFERADEMKELLEADIAELNRQLEVVGSGRDEIRIINDQYEKAISLYDEVNSKLSRFLSEQQKVENLEGKIARIGSLSESVDLKLDRVSDANDTLQDLQVRLKQMEDLHEDLGGRYDRLAEKSNVLDAATDGVDKNFQRMTSIEDLLKDVAERILPLRDSLNAAEERQVSLEEDREKIDLVVGKVESIDSTIAELDKKLEDLGKAREWLARTETRLEEINRETQQRVRLLGTLSKREAGGKKSSGSPDMSTREMVVKLAREGWNSEEIATNLKLSRGEVELILELQPKS